ncbi:hypothetical protein [Pararhodobacter sp.]|uniref:hypothetical protein n=1 Tax=Pararhodobacter sp. TaxID=2127056 RepID=UPI002FDE8E5F
MTRRQINQDAFAALWNNHAIPTRRIADALGVTPSAVSKRAQSMGLPKRGKVRNRKVDPELLREMWLAGVSAKEIAAHFGVSHLSCASWPSQQAGLPKRKRGPSGGMNGGWQANLPIAVFWEQRAATAMAADAARIRHAMARRNMVDHQPSSRRADCHA